MELQRDQKLQIYFFFECVFTHWLQCGQSHVLLHFHTQQVVCLSFLSSRLPPGGLHRRLKQFLLKTTFTTFTWVGYISLSNHYLSNMTKMLTLPQKERGSKFCNFELFFSYCKYLNGGTHQGSVSNLIFTETFEWTLSWCRGITKLSVFFFSLKVVLPKSFFCQNKNYCSQENRFSIRRHDEEYLI